MFLDIHVVLLDPQDSVALWDPPFSLLVPSEDGYVHFLTVVFLNVLAQCDYRTPYPSPGFLYANGRHRLLFANECVLRVVEVYQGEMWVKRKKGARRERFLLGSCTLALTTPVTHSHSQVSSFLSLFPSLIITLSTLPLMEDTSVAAGRLVCAHLFAPLA